MDASQNSRQKEEQDEEVERHARIFTRVLQQARSVPDQEHYEHHLWLKGQIEKDRLRAEFWRRMNERLVERGLIAAIGTAILALVLGAFIMLRLTLVKYGLL